MHWVFILGFIGWIGFCILWALIARRLPRLVRILMTLVLVAFLTGVGYLYTEFVVNKGPDDWGSIWHSGSPLTAKYGSANHKSYRMVSYVKDANGSGSGTYHIRFRYDDRAGLILTHYNKTTHQFDHDEIVPDNAQ